MSLRYLLVPLCCALSSLTGCASIVSGQIQSLTVETPGCEEATCELSNNKGRWYVSKTPGSVNVHRSYEDLTAICRPEGGEPQSLTVKSTTKGMAFGNILVGGIIGAGVDMSSGAAYDYPNLLSVPLQCKPSAPLAATSRQARPRLGLRVEDAAQASQAGGEAGARIAFVHADSPAARAGLKAGQVIAQWNGVAIRDTATLSSEVARLAPGGSVEVEVLDGAERRRVTVELGASAEF